MKKMWLCILTMSLAAVNALYAQDIAGEWHGTLKAGPAELRIALHISKAADGSLKATMDSVDQGANGIPIDAVTLAESKLNFTVGAVNASYDGKVNAAGTVISGNFTQGQAMPLDFERGAFAPKKEPKPGKATDIDGTWQGAIDTGQGSLQIIFHIVNTEEGLMAKADVPAQGASGIPVTAVTRDGSALKLEMKQLGGGFEGKIAPDLSAINGTWSQGGNSIPLVLKR